jgi:hypothetical protein
MPGKHVVSTRIFGSGPTSSAMKKLLLIILLTSCSSEYQEPKKLWCSAIDKECSCDYTIMVPGEILNSDLCSSGKTMVFKCPKICAGLSWETRCDCLLK